MWRHQAICSYCGFSTQWHNNRQKSEESLTIHLRQSHNISAPCVPSDYQVVTQRQCDYCLEEQVDSCTKCERDFCLLHSGVIDGLCSCCI